MDMVVVDHEIPLLPHTIDGRDSMRSIADAVEALRTAKRLSEDSRAQIGTIPLRLPTGIDTSIVLVICQAYAGEPTWGVALPTSDTFRGTPIGKAPETFHISRLDRTSVDGDNRVQLSDGTHLHSVDVIPTVICRKLTDIQKRIVYLTIACIEADETCYSALPEGLFPGLRFLDYSTLYGLKLPTLNVIERYIAERDPHLRASRQTIANALSACGMRRPRSGPRADPKAA